MFPDSSSSDEEDGYGEEGVSGARTGYKASGLALRIPPETPSTKGLYPTQHHFRQLWPIYLANIHPVTMILHAPSASEILAEAAKGHGHASKDVEALLFATMGCALNSVTEAECARLLGEKKSILLAKYRRGCEVALANANFLMSSNLCVLQAYTIYLVSPQSNPTATSFSPLIFELGGNWPARGPLRTVESVGDCDAERPETGPPSGDSNRWPDAIRGRDASQAVVSDRHARCHFRPGRGSATAGTQLQYHRSK